MLLTDSRLPLSAGAFAALYGVLAVPAVWAHEPSRLWFVASVVLALTLAVLSAIDLRDYRLPDVLTLPLAAAGLLVSWGIAGAPLWWHAASAVIGFALFAATGAWLGADSLPAVLLLACGAAIVGLLIASRRSGHISSTTRTPFGPFLSFGTWMMWLYGTH